MRDDGLWLAATPPHLQQHVSRLNAPVRSHGASLHDGANVDAAIAPLVALAHDADAQEVVFLCVREDRTASTTLIWKHWWPRRRAEVGRSLTHVECDGDDVQGHCGVCNATEGRCLECNFTNNVKKITNWKASLLLNLKIFRAISRVSVPAPDGEGAVSCAAYGVSAAGRLCSAPLHCWTCKSKHQWRHVKVRQGRSNRHPTHWWNKHTGNDKTHSSNSPKSHQ